jgi:hypothetical protein
MVAVPVRLAPLFAANDSATLPLPLPLLPALIEIQVSFAAAVQAQPAVVVTATVVDDVPAGTFADWGLIANVHAGGGADAAAWVIVATCPATVTVPLRLAPVLAAIDSATLPLPEPLAPAVMTIQDTLGVAVQAQPLPAVTLSGVAVPPAATIDCALGANAKEHAGGGGGGAAPAPTCETETSTSATRTTVARAAPAFAATSSTTVALPLPPVIDAVTHAAPGVVDHAQPAELATTISNDPPPAAADTC